MNKKFFITVLAGIGVFASVGAGVPSELADFESRSDSHISKSFHFETTKVTGYLGNPEPIIIHGDSEQVEADFVINRSFKYELRVNIDKETISRMAGN